MNEKSLEELMRRDREARERGGILSRRAKTNAKLRAAGIDIDEIERRSHANVARQRRLAKVEQRIMHSRGVNSTPW